MSEEKKKTVEIVFTGEKVDLSEWQKGNKSLAMKTAVWLSEKGCPVAISTTDDGAITVDYSYKGVIQPTIRIYEGKLIWPKGTDFELMMAFLSVE